MPEIIEPFKPTYMNDFKLSTAQVQVLTAFRSANNLRNMFSGSGKKQVTQACRALARRRLIVKDNGYWLITQLGANLAKYILSRREKKNDKKNQSSQ